MVAQMIKNPPVVQEICSMPGSGKSHGEGNGNPLQYSYLEKNSMDRGACGLCSPWGCKESDTTEQLTHFHSTIFK